MDKKFLNSSFNFRAKLKAFLNKNLELFFWLAGITFLLIISPFQNQHFTFCLFNNIGIDFCPGCGLGTSISHLMHFNFAESFTTHPFGIPALLIIVHRIISLLRNNAMPDYQSAEQKTGVL